MSSSIRCWRAVSAYWKRLRFRHASTLSVTSPAKSYADFVWAVGGGSWGTKTQRRLHHRTNQGSCVEPDRLEARGMALTFWVPSEDLSHDCDFLLICMQIGCDYAGIIEDVGNKVTKGFKKGDRVAGFAHGGHSPKVLETQLQFLRANRQRSLPRRRGFCQLYHCQRRYSDQDPRELELRGSIYTWSRNLYVCYPLSCLEP